MLRVKTTLNRSAIHGYGLFAAQPIRAGKIVWRFRSPDRRIPVAEADTVALHYGYINPQNPNWLVQCADDACFWNFAESPNCGEAQPPTATRESDLIALRDIAAGEELTLGVETDADASRKLGIGQTNQETH